MALVNSMNTRLTTVIALGRHGSSAETQSIFYSDIKLMPLKLISESMFHQLRT